VVTTPLRVVRHFDVMCITLALACTFPSTVPLQQSIQRILC
jgi:hypothetical protein